jgi:hypothetical protein
VRLNWAFVWLLVGLLIAFLEGIAVGRPAPGDTLSETLRGDVRFDMLGRFVFLGLWSWLTWHWALRPKGYGKGWADVMALCIGLAWASYETWKRPGGI